MSLRQHQNFHEIAPVVTIQEVLRWEFGERVLEHTEFENVAQRVTTAMLKDGILQGAIQRIIEDLVAAG